MSTELVRPNESAALTSAEHEAALEARDHAIATNDLSKLAPRQRVGLVLALCKSLALNPLSRPFEFLVLDGKVTLYATKSATEQLGRLHQISVKRTREANVGDLHVVEVEGRQPNGRTSFATKYVSLRDGRGNPLAGQKLGDAYAKAETGAKRRLILSMVGLAGLPDDDEAGGRPARRVWMDAEGNLIEHPTEEQRYLIEHPRAARASGYATLEDTATAEDSPVRGASQAPTAEELTPPPRPSGPRPTFKASDEDVAAWQKAYFAAVDRTSLKTEDGRDRYIRQWSDGRTESLMEFLRGLTERQASDFLAHTRVLADEERAAIAASSQPDDDDEPLAADERPF
jgi:hypothetical protein